MRVSWTPAGGRKERGRALLSIRNDFRCWDMATSSDTIMAGLDMIHTVFDVHLLVLASTCADANCHQYHLTFLCISRGLYRNNMWVKT